MKKWAIKKVFLHETVALSKSGGVQQGGLWNWPTEHHEKVIYKGECVYKSLEGCILDIKN